MPGSWIYHRARLGSGVPLDGGKIWTWSLAVWLHTSASRWRHTDMKASVPGVTSPSRTFWGKESTMILSPEKTNPFTSAALLRVAVSRVLEVLSYSYHPRASAVCAQSSPDTDPLTIKNFPFQLLNFVCCLTDPAIRACHRLTVFWIFSFISGFSAFAPPSSLWVSVSHFKCRFLGHPDKRDFVPFLISYIVNIVNKRVINTILEFSPVASRRWFYYWYVLFIHSTSILSAKCQRAGNRIHKIRS